MAGARVAGVSTPDTTNGSGPTTTSTTTPPQRPTGDDTATLAVLQGLELQARDLYTAALAVKGTDEVAVTVFSVLRDAHDAYAQSITGMLGRNAGQTPGTGLGAATMTGDTKALAAAGYQLESQLVATHQQALTTLASTDAGTLVASIAVAEARHGVVLADLMGSTSLDELLVAKEAAAVATKG